MSPKFPFVTQGGFRASPQTYHKQGSVIQCMWSVFWWLSQWWVALVLLELYDALVDRFGI